MEKGFLSSGLTWRNWLEKDKDEDKDEDDE